LNSSTQKGALSLGFRDGTHFVRTGSRLTIALPVCASCSMVRRTEFIPAPNRCPGRRIAEMEVADSCPALPLPHRTGFQSPGSCHIISPGSCHIISPSMCQVTGHVPRHVLCDCVLTSPCGPQSRSQERNLTRATLHRGFMKTRQKCQASILLHM
jgi:hypothetical protein